MGKKHFCFFQTAETGNRTPDSGVKGSGANHFPRAPALQRIQGYSSNDNTNLNGVGGVGISSYEPQCVDTVGEFGFIAVEV